MKAIEEQFNGNPALHDPAFMKRKEIKHDEVEEGANQEKFSNQRLMTPKMRKLATNRDARELLQEQVNESMLRLKKAKFGHKLEEIVPEHKNQFYLPNKESYFPKEKVLTATGSMQSMKSQKGERKSLMSKYGDGSPMIPQKSKYLKLDRS
jgi:hypothetical protein